MKDTTYKKHTGKSVATHKNVEHLENDQKKMLEELMSQFEDITKGTVGNYKNMEVF